ncbi:MAG: methionine--tRNA ligase subunit beta, partial [Pyrinomonadaceae bacterium]
LEHARDAFVQQFEEFAFHRALETAWGVIARADKMISDAKPWELARDAGQRDLFGAVLYRAAETLRWLASMLYPVLPESMPALWGQLGQVDDLARLDPAQLEWGGLRVGTNVGEVSPLFPRLDKKHIMDEIKAQIESEGSGAHTTEAEAVPGAPPSAETQPAPPMRGATEADAVPAGAQQTASATPSQTGAPEGVVSQIGIEDFAKVELRVGQVLTAERVPKSDKLLRFTVDLGEPEPRQILAGIAEHYEPGPLVGRKIVVVSNLKPRKLRGLESQGMVLAASIGEEGRPVLATFTEDVPNGARLK